jgi:hypothetical protein
MNEWIKFLESLIGLTAQSPIKYTGNFTFTFTRLIFPDVLTLYTEHSLTCERISWDVGLMKPMCCSNSSPAFLPDFVLAYSSSTLKMDAIFCSETSTDFYRTAFRYFPQYWTLHSYRCENFKSDIIFFCFCLEFEVHTAVSSKIKAWWKVTPCSLVRGYQSFGGICFPHFEGRSVFTIKMEAAFFLSTFGTHHQSTRCHTQKECNLDAPSWRMESWNTSFNVDSFFRSSAALQPFVGPWPRLHFRNLFLTQTVGLLGRGISPSQDRYLHTGQRKHGINAHTDIHALSGIRTHDPSVRALDRAATVIG